MLALVHQNYQVLWRLTMCSNFTRSVVKAVENMLQLATNNIVLVCIFSGRSHHPRGSIQSSLVRQDNKTTEILTCPPQRLPPGCRLTVKLDGKYAVSHPEQD